MMWCTFVCAKFALLFLEFQMKLIALKIDVDNLSAIELGVPRLSQLLLERECGATFFWSLGHEKNGTFLRPARGLRRFHGAGVQALNARFGWKSLLRGSFLPSPALKRGALTAIKALQSSSFEHGVRPTQNYEWQRHIPHWSPTETVNVLQNDVALFTRLSGQIPVAFSAKSWQGNRGVYRAEQIAQISFSSDTRGISPFFPVSNAEVSRCMQLPVTLPMLEEIQPFSGVDRVDVILALTRQESTFGHVYNAAADFDGVQAADDFARLLDGWLAQGYQVVSLGEMYRQIKIADVPYHDVEYLPCEGRYGLLATQGRPYPS
jgi:undecaprenyl phosphate-alpha-L-ara4FN deformylase